jgi:hypothetical protein
VRIKEVSGESYVTSEPRGVKKPTQRQVTETYWSVCWKWIVPYPCKKSRTVTKWCYDFSYLTVDYHYVYTNYVGCEFNNLYKWRTWELSFSSGAMTLYFITKCYGSLRPQTGACSNDGAIEYVRKALGDDVAKLCGDAS